MTDDKKPISFAAAKLAKEIEQIIGKCGTEVKESEHDKRKRLEKEQRDRDNASLIARWNLRKPGKGGPSGGGGGGPVA